MSLSDSPERAPPDSGSRARDVESRPLRLVLGVLGEEPGDMRIARLREERGDVVVERVAVLFEPAFGAVLDLAGVVLDGEPLLQAGRRVLAELGRCSVCGGELVELVRDLRRFWAPVRTLCARANAERDSRFGPWPWA